MGRIIPDFKHENLKRPVGGTSEKETKNFNKDNGQQEKHNEEIARE